MTGDQRRTGDLSWVNSRRQGRSYLAQGLFGTERVHLRLATYGQVDSVRVGDAFPVALQSLIWFAAVHGTSVSPSSRFGAREAFLCPPPTRALELVTACI
jgi:hypothetical protein